MKNNCLNCKYEPEWNEPWGGKYLRRAGFCKYEVIIENPHLPPIINIDRTTIQHYLGDDSLDPSSVNRCKAWEAK